MATSSLARTPLFPPGTPSFLLSGPEARKDSLAGAVLRPMGPSAHGRDNCSQDHDEVTRTSADMPSTRALGRELLVLVTACSCPLTPIRPYWDGTRGTKVDRTPVMSGGLVGLRPLHWAPPRAQLGLQAPVPTTLHLSRAHHREEGGTGSERGAELPLSYLP